MESLPKILTAQDLLYIWRGMRNGFYYGGKIRSMHSIVMGLLFMKGTPLEIFKKCSKQTLEHAFRLAIYIGQYKTTIAILKNIHGRRAKWHYLVAGCINGFAVYRSKDSAINQQIILYLLSRVVTGGAVYLQNKEVLPKTKFFPILAAIVWALVMFLFEDDPGCLQSSLTGSMEFLYHESETYNGWTDLVPVYIPESVKTIMEKLFL